MKRLLSILFWSILSAAFIGPGTVTVASKAGHGFGLHLLWALTFSTIACVVLQEASARITVLSGRDLGQALRARFAASPFRWPVLLLVVLAIGVGCAAYQAGNILGGVAGVRLGLEFSTPTVTLVMGAVAFLLLWFGSVRWVARSLGIIVALMGVVFLVTAAALAPPLGALLAGAFVPSFPAGSGLLVLGLVGTTVVPYNLFLGSGLARGQPLSELRFGLAVAIVLGGVVSMGVLVVGTAVAGEYSFAALADTLARRLGAWAGPCFATGLFAAGLSSAITAPLAAAVTAESLFGAGGERPERSVLYRGTWLAVLLTGVLFGLCDARPVPAILVAQATNGVLLPFVAVFLLVLVNDRALVGVAGRNGPLANLLLALVVAVTVLLGLTNVLKAVGNAFGLAFPGETSLLCTALALTLGLAVPVGRLVQKVREG